MSLTNGQIIGEGRVQTAIAAGDGRSTCRAGSNAAVKEWRSGGW